jgi:transcriptional regulator with XRE-family HTH domain
MRPSPAPSVRFRRIGLELRRLREERGLTLLDAEGLLERSTTSLSRIETGMQAIPARDLEFILIKYGVTDGSFKEAMLELARQGRKKGWWHRYAKTLSRDLMDFLSLEADAKSISTFQTVLIPGLLQTPEYARALIAGTRTEIKRAVEVRMARQEVLEGDTPPPRLHAVIGEAALRQRVGGARVMRAQLRRLVEMSELAHVGVRVIPFEAGAHQGLNGPFTLLEVGERGRLSVVTIETLHGMSYVEHDDDVRRFAGIFDEVAAAALPESDSRALIDRIRSRL